MILKIMIVAFFTTLFTPYCFSKSASEICLESLSPTLKKLDGIIQKDEEGSILVPQNSPDWSGLHSTILKIQTTPVIKSFQYRILDHNKQNSTGIFKTKGIGNINYLIDISLGYKTSIEHLKVSWWRKIWPYKELEFEKFKKSNSNAFLRLMREIHQQRKKLNNEDREQIKLCVEAIAQEKERPNYMEAFKYMYSPSLSD